MLMLGKQVQTKTVPGCPEEQPHVVYKNLSVQREGAMLGFFSCNTSQFKREDNCSADEQTSPLACVFMELASYEKLLSRPLFLQVYSHKVGFQESLTWHHRVIFPSSSSALSLESRGEANGRVKHMSHGEDNPISLECFMNALKG